MEQTYAIEMLNITKRFPGIVANDNITLQLKKGEIHALLGENGAGKSTLMSVLFGLYRPEEGVIKKDGRVVEVKDPNDANALGIGMVHQHFKLVECFTVLDNIIMGVEPCKHGFLQKAEAREKVLALSEKYGLRVDPDALVEDITVGMQQRTEILKMLYRENEILIFDEPTAVLTPQEIEELMQIMRNLAAEGKSILFISHKLNEIMAVADRCSVLRKGKYIGTVDIKDTTREELSRMMVGRDVEFVVHKEPAKPRKTILEVEGMTVASRTHSNDAVKHVSFNVRAGEIVCIAGIDGNGQTELVYGLTGLEPLKGGKITLEGQGTTKANSAIVHAGYDPAHGTLMARLNIRGSEMMEALCRDLSVKYKRVGSFVLAFDEAQKEHLEKLYRNGVENGVPGMELLDGDQARAMEPALAENVLAALYAPSAAIIDPWGL